MASKLAELLKQDYCTYTENITNGVVLHSIIYKHKKNFTWTAEDIIKHYGLNCHVRSLIRNIQLLLEEYKCAKKCVARDFDKIVSSFAQAFKLPSDTLTPKIEQPRCKRKLSPQQDDQPSPKRLRKDCEFCPKFRAASDSVIKKLKTNLHAEKGRVAGIKKVYNVKVVNQRSKRHRSKIEDLEQMILYLDNKRQFSDRSADLSLRKQKKLKNENKRLGRKVATLETKVESLERELASLKSDLKTSEVEKGELKEYADFLESINTDLGNEKTVVETVESKKYKENMRMVIYKALLCSVPVRHAGALVEFVLHTLAGVSVSRVPSPTTVAQMAYELGVLSLLQTTRILLDEKRSTLSWDATSIDGDHVNEIHVTVSGMTCFVLDVRAIPGGTATDYTDHVLSALTDAASTYASYSGCSEADIMATLQLKIRSTVTDRAAVNHCVVQKLEEAFGHNLIELNCNVHPLDSVASDSRAALREFDKSEKLEGHCYGSEGCATNLIFAVSKIRYKQSCGDPLSFKTFFQKADIPIGTFVRYVGNRMHVLFHLAGIIIAHHSLLIEYLTKKCKSKKLRAAVLKDIQNPLIVTQLTALGIIGKLITGPWMTHFYANKSNLEMEPLIRNSLQRVSEWVEDPAQALQENLNIFGERLSKDDTVLSALLKASEGDGGFLKVLEVLLQACRAVFNRQLIRYLPGGDLREPSEEMIEEASTAPSHNIASERALGMTDSLWRRCPNATTGFLNGKVRCKINKTLEWLVTQDDCAQLVSFATTEGYKSRKLNAQRKALYFEDCIRRQEEVARKRDATHRNSLARKIRAWMEDRSNETDIFIDCSDAIQQKVKQIADDLDSIVGVRVEHTWEDKGVDVVWYGRVQETFVQPRTKRRLFAIAYWEPNSPESLSDDYDAKPEDVFTDIILGDLVLMQ